MSKKITNSSDPPEPENKVQVTSRQKIISWAVFIPTLVIVFTSLISVVFPALIARTTSPFQDEIYKPDVIDPFQVGALAVPLVVINVIILLIGIVYYKQSKVRNLFKTILNFDLSKKQSLIILAIIVLVFAGSTAGQLGTEEQWVDYKNVKERVNSWTISDFGKSFEPHTKYLLLSASSNIFGNIRVIPFIGSISLLVLTYFFTFEITQNRFAGIVSTILLVQSNVFLSYATSATYDNFWILFYLFSLYLIYKKWQPSPVSFILSVFGKALSMVFLPMSLFFIATSEITKRSKVYSLVFYGAIILLLVGAAYVLQTNYVGTAIRFDGVDFWQGFTSMAFQLRFDYIAVLFLLPLIIMLFLASRKGLLHADSIQIFILTILLSAPFLIGFTAQTNEPYRFVSLSVFFAIGVGVLLSKRVRVQA